MAMLMSTRGGVKFVFVLISLPLLIAAAIYFGQKTGLAFIQTAVPSIE